MQLTKQESRNILKQNRLSLTRLERQQKSRLIKARLLEVIDGQDIKFVHCFEPIEELGEVDVSDFIEGRQLFTSRLIDNKWQIISAKVDNVVPTNFDAIIVPMLGFDNRLQRIGYGGGYYDRFLAGQPKALKIGVCFEIGRVDKLPAEPHDIPLDIVITEEQIYQNGSH